MRMRSYVAAAAVPLLLLGATACSDKDKENKENAGKSCDGVLKPASADAALPGTIPAGVTGATFFEKATAGKTTQYFAYVTGTDLTGTRDTIKNALSGAGYEIEGTDQEEGAEAEAEFKGKGVEGSVQVIPLCQNTLRIRYKVGPQ